LKLAEKRMISGQKLMFFTNFSVSSIAYR
jgi:hypothetical protein